MYATSLKYRLYIYLKDQYKKNPKRWIEGTRLEGLSEDLGYKASNGDRRLRALREEKLIDRRFNGRGCVIYQYVVPKKGEGARK